MICLPENKSAEPSGMVKKRSETAEANLLPWLMLSPAKRVLFPPFQGEIRPLTFFNARQKSLERRRWNLKLVDHSVAVEEVVADVLDRHAVARVSQSENVE
jgi:hypothetical protein